MNGSRHSRSLLIRASFVAQCAMADQRDDPTNPEHEQGQHGAAPYPDALRRLVGQRVKPTPVLGTLQPCDKAGLGEGQVNTGQQCQHDDDGYDAASCSQIARFQKAADYIEGQPAGQINEHGPNDNSGPQPMLRMSFFETEADVPEANADRQRHDH